MLLRSDKIVGDTAWYWLNYVPHIVGYVSGVRFVCLKRDKESTIESFKKRPIDSKPRPNENMQLVYRGYKGHAFPRYKDVTPDESISLYYDEYYDIAENLEKHYSEWFRIFTIDALNTEEGQKEILDFAGFENHNYCVGKKLNASPNGGKD